MEKSFKFLNFLFQTKQISTLNLPLNFLGDYCVLSDIPKFNTIRDYLVVAHNYCPSYLLGIVICEKIQKFYKTIFFVYSGKIVLVVLGLLWIFLESL